MKKSIALTALLLVAACNGGLEPVDSKKFLATFAGPKVPTVDDSLRDSAKKAEQEGNFRQASVYWQQVLAKNPDDADAAFALAESLRRSGDADKAIVMYDQLLAKDPANVAAKESKALALIGKGDFVAPTPLLQEVMKADPKRWKTLNALGILFTTRNLQPEAQQYFNAALTFHPDSPSIYNNLGLSQALSRSFDPAINSLQKGSGLAAAGSVERKRIDLNLALVYASAGKLGEAKAIAESYLDGAALNNNLGLYAHLAKDDQMARAYLNMALTESKTYYAKAWDNLQDISQNGNDNSTPATSRKSKPHIGSTSTPPSTTKKLPPDLFPAPATDMPSTQMPLTDLPPTE